MINLLISSWVKHMTKKLQQGRLELVVTWLVTQRKWFYTQNYKSFLLYFIQQQEANCLPSHHRILLLQHVALTEVEHLEKTYEFCSL